MTNPDVTQQQIDNFVAWLKELDPPTSWTPEDYSCIKPWCRQLVWPLDVDRELCKTHALQYIHHLEQQRDEITAELERRLGAME